jgi:polysaccharide biosynthesis transport protein
MPQESSGASLGQYWDAIRRRRRSMFLAFVITWALACSLAWYLPAFYRSDATILIEKPKVPKQYVLPNLESDPEQEMEFLTQEILSHARLQRIIDELHLYQGGLSGLLASGDTVARMRKDIDIEQVLTQSKPPHLAGFTISYSSSNPRLAQTVASRLTSLFIDENLHAREQESENTTEFLDRQLGGARADLERQTQRVREFKDKFAGQLPGETQSDLQILNGLQMRLQQANDGLNRAEQQKMYLDSMLTAYRDSPSLATALTPVDVETQLARLNTELSEVKSRYTDKYPAVIQVRDQIAKAEKLKAEMDEKHWDDTGLPVSRGVAEIKSQLKETELDIQNRKEEIASMQTEMQAYEKQLKRMPQRDQELADLTSDYNQSRKDYEDLLTKKTDSALATDLERAQRGEHFALLDPPSLPHSPYFPNRFLITLGGLAAALAAALVMAFIRETLDDSIHADREVGGLSKMPVLIAIPSFVTALDIRKRRWRAIAESTCAALVLIMAVYSAFAAYVYG